MLLLCVGCVCQPLIKERGDYDDDDDDDDDATAAASGPIVS